MDEIVGITVLAATGYILLPYFSNLLYTKNNQDIKIMEIGKYKDIILPNENSIGLSSTTGGRGDRAGFFTNEPQQAYFPGGDIYREGYGYIYVQSGTKKQFVNNCYNYGFKHIFQSYDGYGKNMGVKPMCEKQDGTGPLLIYDAS